MIKFIRKHRYDLFIIFVLISTALIAYQQKERFDVFADREAFENLITALGVWGPLVIIAVITLEVIIAPIPGYIPAITAGFVFGPLLGTIYVFIGNVLGTAIVFYIARKLGRKIIERFFKKDRLKKYEHAIARHENWLLIFYFFPVIPIDVISAAFGLSKINWKKFFVVCCAGYVVYSIILTNFGDYLAQLWF